MGVGEGQVEEEGVVGVVGRVALDEAARVVGEQILSEERKGRY